MATRTLRVRLCALFVAVAASVVMALPITASAVEYNDVPDTHWAKTSGIIDGITELGLIKGVDNADGTKSFQPDAKITRAQVAVILSRYAGYEVEGGYPANETAWTDVKDGTWYTAAMNWAEAEGVLSGSDGKVRPNDPITRQELVTVLCRMAGYEGRDVSYDADRFGKFSDSSKVSSWAKASVGWSVENGLMGGAPTLNPKGNATRAEASKMILVFVQGGNSAAPLLKVHQINVGQGDSAFIELPNGETLLIDAGTSSYGSTVVNFIKGKGYSHIDHVVMTHPDADHIGGMAEVIKSFNIGQIYAPEDSSNTQTWENLLDAIAAKGEKIKAVYGGDVMVRDGELTCEFLMPAVIGNDSNNNSAILMIDYGEIEWLFTGDAEAGYILEGTWQDIDVLKVSHHGGNGCTTDELLDMLKPEHAVISVGKNSYGHPTNATLAALDAAKVKVYRTDKSGDISGYSDTGAVWFTASPSKYTPSTGGSTGGSTSGSTGGSSSGSTGGSSSGSSSGGSSSSQNTTVYVTKTGAKYHHDWCPSIARSKNLTALTISQAKSKGYEACKNCF